MIDENSNANTLPKGGKAKSKSGKTIEETYTKKTQLEHILLRPDSYIGSVEKQTQAMWVLDSASNTMVSRPITYVPGLYKIFDEIVVNASDNKQRDPSMNRIEVTINAEENFIRVWNNGNGIPIAVHQEHGIYVPELIFGNLLTGSNFDDNEAKTTGGRNGYGAKLANIFSTKFVVETSDKSRGLKFKQVFSKNMTERKEPVVDKSTGTDFTCVTFYPDLARFKMDCLDEDIVSLLSKRVYDIAGTNTASGKMNVYLNGQRVEARNFEQYMGLYQGIEAPIAFERVNDRWEIGVGVSDGSFQQVSFVNSICTTKGGCHVNYIAEQLTARLAGVVKKKNKGEEVKPNQIKNHLSVFVNALVVNPAFDSQTKENLTTKASAFGSTCVVSDKMVKAIEKSGIVDNILNWAKFKQTAELKKKSGSKRSKLVGIVKLDDANMAGTPKSSNCTLILTEGDSAKALAISGLGVVGRDYYGVFPLKGKLLNVREASHAQIMKNEEIQNVTKILGLTFGKVYQDASSLRYGHLMIMTDQDHDGSHIKGLLINFLHHFWPSLLQIDGFLQQFITPIVKCTKGKKEQTFFTIPEYNNWRESAGKGWHTKYYKGLGTSTAAEAKDYFSNLPVHEIDFEWDAKADDVIDMAFAKKRVEDRKLWLLGMEAGVHIDYSAEKITYDNFVNHELILFSQADNERSIGHFCDGLKPSQRKVLFACFKRNLKQEIKVAQLAGYVSEHSAYHHGEASLTQTIIGMAQNFIGSNNINLLSPCGQFGTRLMGGKDAASPRYVFTKLEAITRIIFHPHDDPLLEYQEDDGQAIEPLYYVPIIPMALVNGSEGIGTGWSSSVPTYNPRDIIQNLRLMIEGKQPLEMKPWYRGFTGEVESKTGKDCNNFTVLGRAEEIDEQTVLISELPVGKWTTDYKQFLETVLIGGAPSEGPAVTPFVKDFKENHTDTSVLFTVTLAPEKLLEIHADKGLLKRFKLEGSVATSNMHMFDLNSQIRRYDGPMHLMADFFAVRLQTYDRRKAHLSEKLTEEWERLDNKMRFVLAVIEGQLVVSNRKKVDLMIDLRQQGFKQFREKGAVAVEEEEEGEMLDKGYDYLLSMKIWSLTMERVQELVAQRNLKRGELDELSAKTAEMLWQEDLCSLEDALDNFEAAVDEEKAQEQAARRKAQKVQANKGKGAKKGKAKAKKGSDSDDDDSGFDFEERPKAAPRAKASASAPKPKPVQSSITQFLPKEKATAATAARAAPAPARASAPAAKAAIPAPAPAAKARVEEDMRENVSLFDRIRAQKAAASSAPAASASASSSAAPAKGKAKAAPKKTAKATTVDLCDSEEEGGDSDDDIFRVSSALSAVAVSDPPREGRARAQKPSYAYADSDEEDGSMDHSDVEEDSEEDEEFSDDEVKVVKGPKSAKAPQTKAPPAKTAATKAPAQKAKAKGAKAGPADHSSPAEKATRKRGAKGGDSLLTFSPALTPKAAKKARAQASSPSFDSDEDEELAAMKAAKPTAKPAKAAKAAAKPAAKPAKAATKPTKPAAKLVKKAQTEDSDDEAEFDDGDDEPLPAALRSPKPQRARKAMTYVEEEEEEEDSFVVEDEEEESDFSEED